MRTLQRGNGRGQAQLDERVDGCEACTAGMAVCNSKLQAGRPKENGWDICSYVRTGEVAFVSHARHMIVVVFV